MSPVLSREALHALTGFRNPSKQVEWFRKELGLEPPIGADGRPRVSQAVVDQATLARSQGLKISSMQTPAHSEGPCWTVAA